MMEGRNNSMNGKANIKASDTEKQIPTLILTDFMNINMLLHWLILPESRLM
jgi:hypothetical protein